MASGAPNHAIAPLGREEYVEQAHFFRSLAERLQENIPAQEVLASVQEELLATTKLPMAIDYMLSELRHAGAMGPAMARLGHYFTPLQAYIVGQGEHESGRFDLRVGFEVLQREAEYRAGVAPTNLGTPAEPTPAGLFLYQFESLCRNRLSYYHGMAAMAADPAYDATWRRWIESLRHKVGIVDVADLIYVHSEHYQNRKMRAGARAHATAGRPPARQTDASPQEQTLNDPAIDALPHVSAGGDAAARGPIVLFGEREGRIALANRRRDPLLLFGALHRHLGYPEPPRHAIADEDENPLPQIARRLEQLEKRLTLLEEENRGGFDLTKFYEPPR